MEWLSESCLRLRFETITTWRGFSKTSWTPYRNMGGISSKLKQQTDTFRLMSWFPISIALHNSDAITFLGTEAHAFLLFVSETFVVTFNLSNTLTVFRRTQKILNPPPGFGDSFKDLGYGTIFR